MLSLAEQLKEEQSLLVFGRGYNYATALEAALKARSLLAGSHLLPLCTRSIGISSSPPVRRHCPLHETR